MHITLKQQKHKTTHEIFLQQRLYYLCQFSVCYFYTVDILCSRHV